MDNTKEDRTTYTTSKGGQGRDLRYIEGRGFIPITSIAERNFRKQKWVNANGDDTREYTNREEAKIKTLHHYFGNEWFDLPDVGDAISRGLHMRAMNQGTSNQPLKCDKCDRIYHANIRPAPGTDAWEYLDSNIFGNLNLDIKTCWKCEES